MKERGDEDTSERTKPTKARWKSNICSDGETFPNQLPLKNSDIPGSDDRTTRVPVEAIRNDLELQIKLYDSLTNTVAKDILRPTISVLIRKLRFRETLQRIRMFKQNKSRRK